MVHCVKGSGNIEKEIIRDDALSDRQSNSRKSKGLNQAIGDR